MFNGDNKLHLIAVISLFVFGLWLSYPSQPKELPDVRTFVITIEGKDYSIKEKL